MVQAFSDNINKELKEFSPNVQDDVVILFSAHSLPMRVGNHWKYSLVISMKCCHCTGSRER